MNLVEYQGKDLLARYGIPIPRSKLITPKTSRIPFDPPLVLKSQVPVGDRWRKGGIVMITHRREYPQAVRRLWHTPIDGHLPGRLLVEEKLIPAAQRYVSLSYDTAHRTPVLALNAQGGTGIMQAHTVVIDPVIGLPAFLIREAVLKAGFKSSRSFVGVVEALWSLFSHEQALLVEINPLFELSDGRAVAADAKIILDYHVVQPEYRPYIELGGDIALLASGGGASMINLDALLQYGGRPANYVEYSGNPKAEVVAKLTKKVLSRPGLKGCWVVGGTANFTDIYETLSGFVRGLQRVTPRPTYPIVIRRDGPRREEAFAMLREVTKKYGYDFHLYGPEIPMSQSAKIMVKLAYSRKKP